MWVVKLGGSLWQSPHLPLWLDALAETDAVIVPGGGPFADAVRHAQASWHFDDRTAHHMAILAMRQYGRMLMGLCPRLAGADSPQALRELKGRARVWLPLPEPLDDAGIPASWDITSDSLAAWLAGRVDASNLLLVKSVSAPGRSGLLPTIESAAYTEASSGEMSCEQLVNRNWIDPAFRNYAVSGDFLSWLCGPHDYLGLAPALADPSGHFIRIRQAGRGSIK